MNEKIQRNSIGDAFPNRILILSVCLAFFINLIPLQGWAQMIRPDFLVLVVLFWSIHAPHKVSFFAVFFLGILGDVANGSIIGQTSLLYVLLTVIGISAHRRVRLFKPLGQMLHVFPALVVVKVGILGLLLLVGASFPGWHYFYPTVSTVLLWPLVSFLINLSVSSFGRN